MKHSDGGWIKETQGTWRDKDTAEPEGILLGSRGSDGLWAGVGGERAGPGGGSDEGGEG